MPPLVTTTSIAKSGRSLSGPSSYDSSASRFTRPTSLTQAQPNLLELAKQGNAKALTKRGVMAHIAALMHRQLLPMLDISFYTTNAQPPYTVEVSKDFLLWLAESDFYKIGKSVTKKIEVEGEEEKLPLVQLGKDTRRKLRAFIIETISQESDAMLTQLGDSPSKKEYQDATYRLRKLQELRKCVENEKYQYLQRV